MSNDKSAPTTISRLQRPLTDYFGLPAYIPPAASVQLDISAAGASSSFQFRLGSQSVSGLANIRAPNFRQDLTDRINQEAATLSFFVATVADPRDSQAGYRFDFQIDTLHRAFGAEHFSLARYYLPWDDNSDLHRNEPRVLLYRRAANCTDFSTSEKTDLLVVYLVGETPTAGIHKQAFQAAIMQAAHFQDSICSANPIVSICGPTFTGSTDSLATSLKQNATEQLSFNIITGSATNVDRARFETLAGVPIRSTIAHGEALKQALINHIVKRCLSKVKIAWLSETTSGFGVASLTNKSWNEKVELVEFPFPLNLAGVRATYEEQRRREQSGQTPLGRERFGLPISFNDNAVFRDVPPMQTALVTAPSHEIILGQIVNTIRNENIQYVGISATDARDPIFLSQVIREQCPNVQIMIVAADYLHLNSEHRKVLHGALVASTYSLYPEEQHWCYPFGNADEGNSIYQVLSNEAYIGTYNAAVLLRGLQSHAFHYVSKRNVGNCCVSQSDATVIAVPLNSLHPLPTAYGFPFEPFNNTCAPPIQPDIWISRIGPTALYPVAATKIRTMPDYTL